jgi:hypothetical protein
MTRLPLLICLSLAWFFVANVLLSLGIAAVGAWCHARNVRSGDAALPLRLLPFAGAVVFVGLVFVPAFVAHEQVEGPEPVGWLLRAAAAGALVLVAAGVRRGLAARRRARAIVEAWVETATPIELDDLAGTGIRAYVIEDSFPIVSLAGICRPRLFIARHVLAALTPGELRGALAHEAAHRRAWDNAKRALLCWSPDLLGWFRAGRDLERQWAAAAESAADHRAAADSPARGLDLAGALVKVSRLAVGSAPRVVLFSTLDEHGDVAARVSRLVAQPPPAPPRRSSRRHVLVLVLVGATIASVPQIWPSVHAVTEWCVRLLP